MRKAILTTLFLFLAISPTAAWTLRTGADSRSGVPYAIATQHADGTGEVLGIECQKGQEVMVGVMLDEKVSDHALYPPRRLEFRVGAEPPVTITARPEPSSGRELVYNTRISKSKETSNLLVYLLLKKGDLVVTMPPMSNEPAKTMVFRDDDREASIMDTLKSCGINASKQKGNSRSDLNRRLEGLWATDTRGCKRYVSGALDRSDMDMHTLRSFGLAEFRDGHLDLKYQAATCQITSSSQLATGRYGFDADCEVKGETAQESGAATFISPGKVRVEFMREMLLTLNLTKCPVN